MIRTKRDSVKFLCVLIIFLTFGSLVGSSQESPPEQWNRTFGGIDNDVAYSVQQTSEGGFIVAGSKARGNFYANCWLIKTDSEGNLLWDKTFGDIICNAHSVQQTLDGGYIFAGSTSYIIEKDPVSVKVADDFLLVKTDSNGNKQWNKTFRRNRLDTDFANSVWQTSDGGYIIAGWTKPYDTPSGDFWLIKTDSNGNEQWNKTFGGTGDDSAISVKQTSDGGYVIAGSTDSYGTGSSRSPQDF